MVFSIALITANNIAYQEYAFCDSDVVEYTLLGVLAGEGDLNNWGTPNLDGTISISSNGIIGIISALDADSVSAEVVSEHDSLGILG